MIAPRLKVDGRVVFESARQEEQFEKLISAIREYDSRADSAQALAAIDWASRKHTNGARAAKGDFLPGILEKIGLLTKLGHAGFDTILAAILDESFADGKRIPNPQDLEDVRQCFGEKVHAVLHATCEFRSVKFRPYKPFEKEKNRGKTNDRLVEERQKHLHHFRIMALFASSRYIRAMPQAILIACASHLRKLKTINKPGNKQHGQEIVFRTEEVFSKIAGVAGLDEMQTVLMDESFRIKDRKNYVLFCKFLQDIEQTIQVGEERLTRQKLFERIQEALIPSLNATGISPEFYHFEFRVKSPSSTFRKMRNLGIDLNMTEEKIFEALRAHIFDIIGVRVVVDAEAYKKDWKGLLNAKMDIGYELCKKIHRRLTIDMPRVYQEERDEVTGRAVYRHKKKSASVIMPLVKKLFKDYGAKPKANGYRAIHDVLEILGHPIDVQLVTKQWHEVNRFGIASHGFFKIAPYKSERATPKPVVDWYAAVRGQTGTCYTGAYASDNRIVLRRAGRGLAYAMNIAEFAHAICVPKAADCVGAHRIERTYPFEPLPEASNGLHPLTTPLCPGDVVQLSLDEGLCDQPEQQEKVRNALRRPRDRRELRKFIAARRRYRQPSPESAEA